jgi:predicted transcriptional regulator
MIRVSELTDTFCISRNTMRKIIKVLANKKIINQNSYAYHITNRSYEQIKRHIGIGKFETRKSMAKKYSISYKSFMNEIEIIKYELKELEVCNMITPRQQQEIYDLLGKPEDEN